MMRRLLLAALPATALAACATAAPPPGDPSLPLGSCDAAPAQSYVGQVASQDIGARMQTASGARVLRWVGFGQMVTMEYRADRLTVRLDRNNVILGVTCG